jgi:hypothetical protein
VLGPTPRHGQVGRVFDELADTVDLARIDGFKELRCRVERLLTAELALHRGP